MARFYYETVEIKDGWRFDVFDRRAPVAAQSKKDETAPIHQPIAVARTWDRDIAERITASLNRGERT